MKGLEEHADGLIELVKRVKCYIDYNDPENLDTSKGLYK